MTVAENIICWFAMSAPYQKEFLPGERKESRLQNPIIFEYLLYWLLILLGLVPFVAGAYVYLRYQPPVYAVSSELLLWLWQIRSLWQVWLWQEVWVWIREPLLSKYEGREKKRCKCGSGGGEGGACLGKLRKLRTFIFGNLRLNVYICELET